RPRGSSLAEGAWQSGKGPKGRMFVPDPLASRPHAHKRSRLTDRIDAWVLAELSRRELVPAIWLPDPLVRAERERACWRLHLVRHRSSLKQRVHAVLLTHGEPCPSPICSVCAAASCSPDSGYR